MCQKSYCLGTGVRRPTQCKKALSEAVKRIDARFYGKEAYYFMSTISLDYILRGLFVFVKFRFLLSQQSLLKYCVVFLKYLIFCEILYMGGPSAPLGFNVTLIGQILGHACLNAYISGRSSARTLVTIAH